MERRKFFKSLGALGLAAIIPKFLLGKEEDVIKLRIVDDGSSKRNESWTSWHDSSDSAKSQSDVIWTKQIHMDLAIKPRGITHSKWIDMFRDGELLYDSSKMKVSLTPLAFKTQIENGMDHYVFQHGDHSFKSKGINISALKVTDVSTGRWVNSDNFCNYMSVSRNPASKIHGKQC